MEAHSPNRALHQSPMYLQKCLQVGAGVICFFTIGLTLLCISPSSQALVKAHPNVMARATAYVKPPATATPTPTYTPVPSPIPTSTAPNIESLTPLQLSDPSNNESVATQNWWQSLIDVGWKLGLVVGLIYVSLRLLAAFKRSTPSTKPKSTKEAPTIALLNTIQLGKDKSLHAIQLGRRYMLMTVNNDQIEILREGELISENDPAESPSTPFYQMLMQTWKNPSTPIPALPFPGAVHEPASHGSRSSILFDDTSFTMDWLDRAPDSEEIYPAARSTAIMNSSHKTRSEVYMMPSAPIPDDRPIIESSVVTRPRRSTTRIDSKKSPIQLPSSETIYATHSVNNFIDTDTASLPKVPGRARKSTAIPGTAPGAMPKTTRPRKTSSGRSNSHVSTQSDETSSLSGNTMPLPMATKSRKRNSSLKDIQETSTTMEGTTTPRTRKKPSAVQYQADVVPDGSYMPDSISSPGNSHSSENDGQDIISTPTVREILWYAEEHGVGVAATHFHLTPQRITALRNRYERERAQRQQETVPLEKVSVGNTTSSKRPKPEPTNNSANQTQRAKLGILTRLYGQEAQATNNAGDSSTLESASKKAKTKQKKSVSQTPPPTTSDFGAKTIAEVLAEKFKIPLK
jgi:flagellar biogenesis protein FliO